MYIGIDIGTSGTKTLLTDGQGNILRSQTREYPLSTPQNGWAEQQPELWRDAAIETIRAVLDGIEATQIEAVGLTGQMHGLVCLDKADNVLCPAILWCDQRTAAECEEITSIVGKERLVELTANPALTGFTSPKILWLRKNEPGIYERTAKIMLPKDYVRYILTGENASDMSDASGTGLLNVAKRDWDPEVLIKLGIEKSLLGRLCESPEIAGRITQSAAALTGLPEGTPVVAGAGDNAAAAIGTGVCKDGQAFVTIGSSGVVYAHTSDMRFDAAGRIHTFCSAVPGEWHVMGVTLAAGMSLKWFRDNFMPGKPYNELDCLAEQAPIGADGLYYLPYLNGERSPHLDPNARGAFLGLSSMHEARHLVRSVIEGVTYSLRDCYDVILQTGLRFAEIAACGGGMSSAFWRRMTSDVFGARVTAAQTTAGPALGAAMLAAVGTGAYSGVAEACSAIADQQPDSVEPDPEAAKEYAKSYAGYKKLYPALRNVP
ncbi:MAG: xylulokinase [Oscillospiraceae bacterium]|nr:xylulokinase [Oscillospiraceae bacterium]